MVAAMDRLLDLLRERVYVLDVLARCAWSGEHPYFSRDDGVVPAPGHALLDRQGLFGIAAFAAQGLLSRATVHAAVTCGHHLEISRDDCLPRSDRSRGRRPASGAHQRRRLAPGYFAIDTWGGCAHRCHEDGGAEAGAG